MLQRFHWVCQACTGANPNRLTMVRSVVLPFLTCSSKYESQPYGEKICCSKLNAYPSEVIDTLPSFF